MDADTITLDMALRMVRASVRWARDVAGFPCSIAVVDASGYVVAAHRMDGAAPATMEVAMEKAWSAVMFGIPTLLMSRWIDPRNLGKHIGVHALGMMGRLKGRLCVIPGGIPVRNELGEVIGAIGCSGIPRSFGEISDTTVSQAGIAALYEGKW